VDIGVSETYSTLVGNSLQLIGVGSSYLDFVWAEPAPSTFGAVNLGQIFLKKFENLPEIPPKIPNFLT